MRAEEEDTIKFLSYLFENKIWGAEGQSKEVFMVLCFISTHFRL